MITIVSAGNRNEYRRAILAKVCYDLLLTEGQEVQIKEQIKQFIEF